MPCCGDSCRSGGSAAARLVTRARGGGRPRGPEAVLASLLRGSRRLGLPVEHAPARLPEQGPVGVLSGLDALAEVVSWRGGRDDRRLLAGPNLVMFPHEAAGLLSVAEVDVCLVPSPWVKELYEADQPALAGRIAIWPAGVDEDYWSPADPATTVAPRRALLYVKELPGQRNVTRGEIAEAERALTAAGFATEVLRYGELTREGYRAALRDACLLVFFSPSESQCLAQVEAWSVGVPTLVWDWGRFVHGGREYRSSSGPFLTAATGRPFADVDDLRALLTRWADIEPTLSPRHWVLDNMTDAICARAYWDLAHG
jgi:hypothetical protein